MENEKKARAPKKVATKESITADIKKIDDRIIALNSKKAKLQAKLVELNQKTILEAIMNSGKNLDEILELINK